MRTRELEIVFVTRLSLVAWSLERATILLQRENAQKGDFRIFYFLAFVFVCRT